MEKVIRFEIGEVQPQRMALFFLNFCQFQSGVAYKTVAYKKSVYKLSNYKSGSCIQSVEAYV